MSAGLVAVTETAGSTAPVDGTVDAAAEILARRRGTRDD